MKKETEETPRYRIDCAYGNVYEYDQGSHAYIFCGKTAAFTKAELKRMKKE
jgi:hypothetical protein